MTFIDGVEYLATVERTDGIIAISLIFFAFAMSGLALLYEGLYLKEAAPIIGGAILIGMLLIGMIYKENSKERYLVTIDETVSMQDFNNNYEIININENVYTIEIKGDN